MKTFLLCLATASLALGSVASATITESFTQTYPLTADGSIHLENVNGDIEIVAWDKPEVSLVAEKRAKDEAELKQIEILIEAAPTRLVIKTKFARKFGWNSRGLVNYKLMVPAGATLDKIDAVNSSITISGVCGPVKLETVNGRITASGLRRDARLESVNGNLRATFDSLGQVLEVRLESVNGRVEIVLPKDASARLKTSTVNGRCNIEPPIRLSNSGKRNLSGDIGGGTGPSVVLDTVNGSIDVQVSKP